MLTAWKRASPMNVGTLCLGHKPCPEILPMKIQVQIGYEGGDLSNAAFIAESSQASHDVEDTTTAIVHRVTNKDLSEYFDLDVKAVVRHSGLLENGDAGEVCKIIADTLNNNALFSDRGMVVKQVVPIIPLTDAQVREIRRRMHYNDIANRELRRQIRQDEEADAMMEQRTYAVREGE